MKKSIFVVLGGILPFLFGFYLNDNMHSTMEEDRPIKLGAFSISLEVKDLKTSKEFYEKLGFRDLGGNMESGYLIMKNGNAIVGLFQGMFEGNILTFNPGWDESAQNIDDFDDVRAIQESLIKDGVELETKADTETTGPAC